jgi:ArsR family transcriptional regulator
LTVQPATNIHEPAPALALTEAIAGLCKAASDPLRIDIVRVLSKESFGVQELARIVGIPQPGMSHHLKILARSGLLEARRQGNSIFYRRALLRGNDPLTQLRASVYQTIDALPLAETFGQRMSAVYQERSQQSRDFFARNAGRFAEQQGMLCELDQYLPNMCELLDLMALPATARVMEVGPGKGELLDQLAHRYAHLVALDNSGEMLELARNQAEGKNRKIHFVHASLEDYPIDTVRFDAVVINMVLHHMSSPQRAMRKLGQLVQAGGYLLVADLCSHNQEWTRESCGDVWLGFDPEELEEWAAHAGFTARQSLYLGLKNGFQIQLRLFRKS